MHVQSQFLTQQLGVHRSSPLPPASSLAPQPGSGHPLSHRPGWYPWVCLLACQSPGTLWAVQLELLTSPHCRIQVCTGESILPLGPTLQKLVVIDFYKAQLLIMFQLRLRATVCLIIHELSYFTILQKVNVGWSCHSWCCVRYTDITTS